MGPPMLCHSERSEESAVLVRMLRCAQHDKRVGGILCGLVLLLAACGSSAAPPSSASAPAAVKPATSAPASAQPASSGGSAAINLAYVAPGTSFFWEWIAYNKGLFKKYGVDVKEPVFVAGTPRLGQGLVAGN